MHVLVQQRALQVDLLAEFLGTGRNHVYELAAELRGAKLVHPLRSLGTGPAWVVPTRAAVTGFFGQRRPDWQPSLLWSVRGRAIARARIALDARAPQAWESERELSYRTDHAGRYPYDGRILRTAGAEAVRVDTRPVVTSTDLAQDLTRAAARASEDGCEAVRYLRTEPTSPTVVRTALNAAHLPTGLTVEVLEFGDLEQPRVLARIGIGAARLGVVA
ncbi:hypothetical protein ACWDYH_03885 [Nocardia goodfellowii]